MIAHRNFWDFATALIVMTPSIIAAVSSLLNGRRLRRMDNEKNG
jgi:hypothetical protein